jgi:hypothetical protein
MEMIFHSDFNLSIYVKSFSLLDSVICLLSQKGSNSFLESLVMGHTSHIKRGPDKGHLPASSKYIVKV